MFIVTKVVEFPHGKKLEENLNIWGTKILQSTMNFRLRILWLI